MIPKIIHYCWFGKGLMPATQKRYIRAWKKLLPDYQFKCWTENNFNIGICEFTLKAYAEKKYAFVSDVARLHALYSEGGIYLDTDVEILNNFDQYLNHRFLAAVELYPDFKNYVHLLNEHNQPLDRNILFPAHGGLSGFAFASEKRHPLIHDLLDHYMNKKFEHYGKIFPVIDAVMAQLALNFGYQYADKEQVLEQDIRILPSDLFCCMENSVSSKSILVHRSAHSWLLDTRRKKIYWSLDKLHLLLLYKKAGKIKRSIIQAINNMLH